MKAELTVNEFGIEKSKEKHLSSGLVPILSERDELIKSYQNLIKLEVTQENISMFRELRLKFRDNRTKGIIDWHKKGKEVSLREGQWYDAKKNSLINTNLECEDKLLAGEKTFENIEKQRLSELQLTREKAISLYIEDASERDLTKFEDDEFEAFLQLKKKQHDDRIEAERLEAERIENERIAKEKAIEEQRLENIRLNKLAEEKEAQLLKERKEAKAKADAIEAKAKLEREKALAEAEELRKQQAIKDAKNLAATSRQIILSKIGLDVDLGTLYSMNDSEWHKLHEDQNNKFQSEQHKIHIQKLKDERKANKDRADKAKLEKELQAVKDAELKAKKEADDKAEALRLEAIKNAKAPIKTKLNVWVNSFELPETTVNNETSKEIIQKFEAFKKWATTQVTNL